MLNRAKLLKTGLVLVACLSVPHLARAQGSSMFNSAGVTRSGTGGISGSLTGSGFSSSGLGSSSRTGSTGFGTTGFGNTGFGNTGFGNTGGYGSTGFGTTGMSGTSGFGATGTQGMVGRNSGAFAGQSMANQTGANGRGTTGGGTRNFNNTGSNRQDPNQNNRNAGNERTTSAIRPVQKVAFDYNAKTATTAATSLATRLAKIGSRNPKLNGVTIKVDGDQLVLTGKVNNPADMRLAVNLLRQEPGVRNIRNELELEPAPKPE